MDGNTPVAPHGVALYPWDVPESTPIRHFLGWDAPALQRAAEHLVPSGPGGRPTGVDLSGLLLVVPGGRAGRLLLERLVARVEGTLIPPEIVSSGSLPERLYTPELPPPDPVLEQRVWMDALRDTGRERLEILLHEPPPHEDAAGWDALATLVLGLHSELGGEGLTFRRVAERCGRELPFNDEARWQVLASIQEDALERLRKLGRMDRDEARRRVVEPRSPALEIVLVGVAELPGITAGLLRKVNGPVRALIHAPPERADDFDDLGRLRPERWEGERLDLPDRILHVVDRPGDQADRVLAELAALDGAHPAESITVGAPDPELLPHLVDRLEEAGVRARPAEGRPLDRTALLRLLTALADVLRTGEVEAWAALLRHPVVEACLDPEGSGALPSQLDRFHSAALQERLPTGVLDGVLAPLRALLEDFDAPGPLRHWPERLRNLLHGLFGTTELRRSHPAERELLESIRHLEGVLQAMEELPEGDPVPALEGLRFLLARLAGSSVAPPADPDAVEVLGWLELHMDDAPVLLLAGVNEPHLPEALGADPFLPNALRTQLGLPDNRSRFARDLYRMKAILHSREVLRLVAGRRSGRGDPLRLSRLLLAEAPEVVALRILGALGEDPQAPPTFERAPRPSSVPHPPVELPPERSLEVPTGHDAIEGLSVTRFRAILADPYAFGLREFRGLEAEGDEARELDAAAFGMLAHDVLERWAREPDAHRMDERTLVASLLDHLATLERQRYGPHPLPAVRIQVEQLRARLRAVARVQAERNAEGWEIRGVEVRPPDPGTLFPVDGLPFHLRGRIDRIDHHPDTGRWALLDYKTSAQAVDPEKAHRKGRGENRRWVDLQLPLYRHLAPDLEDGANKRILPPDPGTLEMGYFLIPSETAQTGVRMATGWDAADLVEADEVAREIIRLLRSGVVEWDGESKAVRDDSDLAAVVGKGTLRVRAP